MAIDAAIVWEVQTGGDDTFGGGFKTGASGTNYSTSAPTVAHATLTTLSVVNATTTKVTVSLTDYTVHANDVGNTAQLSVAGGAFAFYEITAVDTAANTWTVDRSLGTAAQTVEGKMGGALATPGKAAKAASVNGNIAWIKSGTYTLTTATPGSGGPVLTANKSIHFEGYETTRGDLGTRPIIFAGAITGIIMWENANTDSGQLQVIANMELDANNGAGNDGFSGEAYHKPFKCIVRNARYGFRLNTLCENSEAYNCDEGFRTTKTTFCYAKDCDIGFHQTTANVMHKSIAVDCGVGFSNVDFGEGLLFINCLAYGCTGNGFFSDRTAQYTNCVAVNNGAYGFGGTSSVYHTFINCAAFNNTSGSIQTANYRFSAPTALSGDPFDGAGSFDFRPNDTTGEGALLRSLGIGVATQTDNNDIGAVQHADPTPSPGGGGTDDWIIGGPNG